MNCVFADILNCNRKLRNYDMTIWIALHSINLLKIQLVWQRSSPIRAVSLHFCSYGNAAALYGQLACISALMATQHSCYSMQFLWFPVVRTKKIDRRNLPFDEWFQDFNTFEITHQIRGHATVCSNGGASHQGEHKGNIRVRETSEIYNDPRDR